MLSPVDDIARAIAALGAPKPSDFTFRNFCKRPNVLLFASSDDPAALLALNGSDMMLFTSSPEVRLAVLRDLYSGQFVTDSGWPNDSTRRDWEREGNAFLFCNSSPIAVWEAGLEVGFTAPADADLHHHAANLYLFEGAPRLSRHIRHSCRLGRGMELWEQLRQGIAYDPEGYYVRMILQENPSFLCEVAGEPVCWSTVHLNGTLGMIYTPPEHRRRGYARSLTCFALDHQLRASGFACCHVNSENAASYTMLLELGATKEDTPVGWRVLQWPDGTCPYSV